MRTILFIHRSVGRNLLRDGQLRQLLAQAPATSDIQLDDYDGNTGLITAGHPGTPPRRLILPGRNTNPDNLLRFFTGELPAELAKVRSYQTIIVKSCYPNSAITSDQALANIQETYRQLAKTFAARPQQQLIIMTSPPLRPERTNQQQAGRAHHLADWLMRGQWGPNVAVFDLHSLLAESTNPHAGMLAAPYRRLWPWDNHPNPLASRTAAEALAKLLARLEVPASPASQPAH